MMRKVKPGGAASSKLLKNGWKAVLTYVCLEPRQINLLLKNEKKVSVNIVKVQQDFLYIPPFGMEVK